MRASQINGCAYCIDMHSKDARMQGETEQRLYALSAWREHPFSRTGAGALGLTEAVTLIVQTGITEDVIENASSVFSPEELTRLLYLIIEINAGTDWRLRSLPRAWELHITRLTMAAHPAF